MKKYFEKLQSIGLEAIAELRKMDAQHADRLIEYREQVMKGDSTEMGYQNLKCSQDRNRAQTVKGYEEKLDALEPFHPERMASRILGMGDMLSLIEKAQENFDEKKAAELERKMKKNEFTLEDFMDQFSQVRNMGGFGKMLEMLPGVSGKVSEDQMSEGEKEMKYMEAIIFSMTPAERRDPSILNASRRKRIAAGAGVTVTRVNQLIKRYEETKKMMKMLNGGKMKKNRMFKGLF